MTATRTIGTDREEGATPRWGAAGFGSVVGLAAAIALVAGPVSTVAAPARSSPAAAEPGIAAGTWLRAAPDTMDLATGPYSRMETLLERTIFQVNVVRLTVRYDSATAARISDVVEGRDYSSSLADSVSAAVLGARRVNAYVQFVRDIGLDRFLSSVRDNMAKARDAGMLADSAFRRFEGELPGWYSELEGRGVLDGDVTEYQIRGDSLRVVYRSAAGDTLISRTDVGEQHRRAVLGGYLAPGVDFREGLIRSLLRGG